MFAQAQTALGCADARCETLFGEIRGDRPHSLVVGAGLRALRLPSLTLIRMHSVTAAAVAVAAAMTRDVIAALLSASSSLQRGKERERERQEPSKKGSISARCSLESKEGNERRTDLTLPLKTARSGGRRMRKGGRTG